MLDVQHSKSFTRPLVAGLLAFRLCLASSAASAGMAEGIAAFEHLNFEVAWRELRPLADDGEIEAQYRVGFMQLHGIGQEANEQEGLRRIRHAARENHPLAMRDLGRLYEVGKAVRQDGGAASYWYLKAGEAGNAFAYQLLAAMYDAGDIVPKSEEIAEGFYHFAAELYRLGAEVGQDASIYQLGLMYLNGRGVPWDIPHAVRLISEAADAGNTLALRRLGAWCDPEAQRTPQEQAAASLMTCDIVEFYKWHAVAERIEKKIYPNARFSVPNLNDIAARLTQGELAEARARADAWRPKAPRLPR